MGSVALPGGEGAGVVVVEWAQAAGGLGGQAAVWAAGVRLPAAQLVLRWQTCDIRAWRHDSARSGRAS